MDKKKKGKAKFFGFEISKSAASIVLVLGILVVIGNLVWLLILISSMYSTYLIYQTYAVGEYAGYFSYSLWSWAPSLIMIIAFIILGLYMIQCGKKGR